MEGEVTLGVPPFGLIFEVRRRLLFRTVAFTVAGVMGGGDGESLEIAIFVTFGAMVAEAKGDCVPMVIECVCMKDSAGSSTLKSERICATFTCPRSFAWWNAD